MDTNVDMVGNLTREPELRFTPGGLAVTTFGLAVNRRVENKATHEWEDKTGFYDVTCFGALAENVAESLPKGARTVVVGRLDHRSWETAEGDKRSKVEVVAEEVAPSLRWATVDITKNPKADGAGRPAPRIADAPPPTPDDDEEPF